MKNEFRYYVKAIVDWIKDDLKEDYKSFKSSSKTSESVERAFLEGQIVGYIDGLNLLREQAIAYDIPLKEIGLEHPIEDLVKRREPSIYS